MGKRQKGGSQQNDDPVQLARRCLERRDYRQALKHARVAVRKLPGDGTKLLLETVSLARVNELLQSGHVDQARELLSPLVNTIRDPGLRDELPDLLLRSGLVDQFPEFRSTVSDTDRQAFEVDSFDRAVVDLSHARTTDVREQAALVRSALEAVENGNDDAAVESLRGMPRRSLAADWRYFVRGLSAWYANDGNTVDANWSRLDPGRAAARIVAQLTTGAAPSARQPVVTTQSTDGQSVGAKRFGIRADAILPTSVMKAVPTLRSTDGLQQVLLGLANEDWPAVTKAFRQCRSVLRHKAPELFDRIAGKIVSRIIHADDETALRDFCLCVEAPPHDPDWHRARAMLSESLFLDDDECLEIAENRWLQCVRDVDQIDEFSDAEKQIARSLLNTRIGHMSLAEIQDLADCGCGLSHEDDITELRERAAEFLEHAITACPDCADPWRMLIELYETVDDSTVLNATRKRMLAQFPEDLNTLAALAECALDDGDPLQARDYLLRAQRLKPLDHTLRVAAVTAHHKCARKFIRTAEFDAARVELGAAMSLAGSASVDRDKLVDRVTHFVLSAVLELSAENNSEADRWIDEALKIFTEPTAVHLQLTIEAARVNLPQSTIERFEGTWRDLAGKKCHTQTAGEMARLMSGEPRDDCPERVKYAADVLTYIKRANRVRFTCVDLRNVCEFLHVIDEHKLFEKHVDKGRRRFPDEPWFHLAAAEAEMDKGVYDCRRRLAFDGFSRVLEICDQSADADHQIMAEAARRRLSFLNEVGLRAPRKPRFSRGRSSPGPIFSDMPPDTINAVLEELGVEIDADGVAGEKKSAGNGKRQGTFW